MDLGVVRMFVKVAELASFTRAAAHLGVSKASVSLGVRALEEELESQLLQRTTRAVRLTPDGEQFYGYARRLVLDADALSGMFRSRTLRGSVRVDLPVAFARNVVIPRLPELLKLHPQLSLMLSTTDRRTDVVREGFDVVLRIGALSDSGLVARKLGNLQMVNCASPAYLREYGTPHTLEDLKGHLIVHYSLAFGVDAPSFEYPDGSGYRELPMRSVITVNGSDSYQAACLAGLGIIQAPRSGMLAHLASGALVEVLPQYRCAPMPVSLVHAHVRQVPPRVRAVMTWLESVMATHLEPGSGRAARA